MEHGWANLASVARGVARGPVEAVGSVNCGSVMREDVERRMSAAAGFVDQLAALRLDDWRQVADEGKLTSEFYALALELVNDATQLVGESLAAEYDAFLTEQYGRIDAIIASLPSLVRIPVATHLAVMAKAATNAVLVRNSYDFSIAAFNELTRPFRWVTDLGHAPGRRQPEDDRPRI
jgi:hypothetical protein